MHKVIHDVKVQNLRKDDELSGPEYGIVESIDWKTKFVYVTVQHVTKPLRIAVDTELKVVRLEKTEEENLAERREIGNMMVVKWIASAHTSMEIAKEALLTHVAKGYTGVEKFEDYVSAQNNLTIAIRLQQGIDAWSSSSSLPTLSACNGSHDPIDVAKEMKESMKESLVDNYDAPHYSGGFSFSNASRQSTQDSKRKFVRGSYWMM